MMNPSYLSRLFITALLVCSFLIDLSSGMTLESQRNRRQVTDECPDQDFREYAVELQNNYRKKHGVPPLTLDLELSKEAQDYADVRAIGNDTAAEAEKLRNRYGLITMQNDGTPISNPKEAVKRATQFWYASAVGYNWDSPLNSKPTANIFTQMVWKGSKKIGVGVASVGNRTVVIVFYDPPGNEQLEQSFKDNVFPAQN